MPVYQYACTECGHELEARQSFSDDPLTVCPTCEGRLRKVLSAVGVVFKGSGFYRTDSRKQPAGASASGNGTGESSSQTSAGAANGAGSGGTGSGGTGAGSGSGGAGASTAPAAAAG